MISKMVNKKTTKKVKTPKYALQKDLEELDVDVNELSHCIVSVEKVKDNEIKRLKIGLGVIGVATIIVAVIAVIGCL